MVECGFFGALQNGNRRVSRFPPSLIWWFPLLTLHRQRFLDGQVPLGKRVLQLLPGLDPLRELFIRNPYIPRTFQIAGQSNREDLVRLKFTVMTSLFEGYTRIVIVDDLPDDGVGTELGTGHWAAVAVCRDDSTTVATGARIESWATRAMTSD